MSICTISSATALRAGSVADFSCVTSGSIRPIRCLSASSIRCLLSADSEHRRMMGLQHAAVAQEHVHTARKTRIEAPNGTHDVDTFEFVGAVLFKDRRVLNGIFIGTRRPVRIARTGIPWCRRIRVVIRNLAGADDDMVRKHASDGFMETARYCIVWDFKVRPGPAVPRSNFVHRLLAEIQSRGCRVCLEIGAGSIPFDRVAPLGDVPL